MVGQNLFRHPPLRNPGRRIHGSGMFSEVRKDKLAHLRFLSLLINRSRWLSQIAPPGVPVRCTLPTKSP
jgi:hypothetical protein